MFAVTAQCQHLVGTVRRAGLTSGPDGGSYTGDLGLFSKLRQTAELSYGG